MAPMPARRASPSTSIRACPQIQRGRRLARALRLATATLAWVVAWSWTQPAWADPRVLVLLLRPLPSSGSIDEALLRIKGELSANGFEVAVIDSDASALGKDPRAHLEQAGQALAPSATMGIVGDVDHGPAELWVVDRITGKTVVRRMEVQPSNERRISEVLAIRAQELLRASLVETLMESQRASTAMAPTPPRVDNWVKQGIESRTSSWRLALEMGVSTLAGFGGIGPSVAPSARLRVGLRERVWIRMTAVGLGSEPRVSTSFGSARVSQNLGLVECVVAPRPRHVLRPLFSLGLGARRIGVDGSAQSPFQGQQSDRWFSSGDVGTGGVLRLGPHWEALLELHALFSSPRPTIRFLDVDAAQAGQPTLLAILTLAGGA